MKVAINGFGRIGKIAFQIAIEKGLDVVAINDPFLAADYIEYLLKYETVHILPSFFPRLLIGSTINISSPIKSVKFVFKFSKSSFMYPIIPPYIYDNHHRFNLECTKTSLVHIVIIL